MKTTSRWIFLAVMIVGLTYGRAPARAQSTSAPIVTDGDDKPWARGVPIENRQTARDLFLEGNRLFRVPLFAQAAEKYAAALVKWKHPAVYFNLALAQLNLGQEVESRENLEHALEYGAEPLGADQFKEAQKQLYDTERQLGRIHISCQTPGAEVTLDGVTVFTGPGSYQGWVKAKGHELTAKKQGYLPEARRVTVSPGNLHEIGLKLVTLSDAEDTGRRWAVWKPWAVVAAGGAIAATGGVLHALSARNFNAYDDKFLQLPCVTMPDLMSPGCTPNNTSALSGQLSLARREQVIAVAGYIGGGALIAAGAMLLYLNRPRLGEHSAANSPGGSVTVAPSVSADTVGILVSISN